MQEDEFGYDLIVTVSCPLTEKQKDQLMLRLSDVINEVVEIGMKCRGGTVQIYSKQE